MSATRVSSGLARKNRYGVSEWLENLLAWDHAPRRRTVPPPPATPTDGKKTMLKTYHGSCHCGAVRFEADIDLAQPTYRCNCSICARNRFWVAPVAPVAFRLLQGKAEVTQYLFNSMQNEHYFCKTCGVRAFGRGRTADDHEMVGVNIGCLDDAPVAELAAAPIRYCDGRNDNWQKEPAVTSYL